jgi:hypothetical protein
VGIDEACNGVCAVNHVSAVALWWLCSCRRWNNTVSLTLRSLCYDPIVEGCWIRKAPAPPAQQHKQHASTPAAAPAGPESAAAAESAPSSGSKGPRVHPLKKLAGTAATFAASGIMHELILLYALAEDDKYPAGFWFMFFFCQVGSALLAVWGAGWFRLPLHKPWTVVRWGGCGGL